MPNVNPAEAGLAVFNALGAAAAETELLACCACPVFARDVAARRPYRDPAELAATADAVVRGLAWPDVRLALAAHPRIGERGANAGRTPGRESSWSMNEQSSVEGAGRAVLAELAGITRLRLAKLLEALEMIA
ncbi:2-oxo-4-hydroxy-4-carboxy-5-ureidoimidazoline decarboxylase [Streptosporangium sp. NPDC051023]|uniref:2-oxo-4-hydroxy-4-carboxy-5-ureidoimidazoline decarboxylase n=1 Tax=Streptosporangium sp. NPDC051023 TaxID=3155410 RepID=UPI00344BCBCA